MLSDQICALIDFLSPDLPQGNIPERFLPLCKLVYGDSFPKQASDAAGPLATLREVFDTRLTADVSDTYPDVSTLQIFFQKNPVEVLPPDADFDLTLRHGFIMDFLGHLRAYVKLLGEPDGSRSYEGGESKSGVKFTGYIKRLFI